MKQVLAFTLGVTHPSARLRVAAYSESFRAHGWNLMIHAFDPGMGKAATRDEFFLHRLAQKLRRHQKTRQAAVRLRQLPPAAPVIISRELPVSRRPFLQAPNPLVLDVDDALYLGSGRERLLELCRRARAVVCGNQTIADRLSAYARRCVVIPTVVDPARYAVRENFELNGPFRLGWLGSSMSFNETLSPFLPMLADIRRRVAFELILISDEFPEVARHCSWLRYVPWSPQTESELASHLDAGIMPLQDNEYQRAKCGSKLLQYMAAGLPSIASPVGANRELVLHGTTGFWASQPAEWEQAIVALASNAALRASLGRSTRAHVAKNYSLTHYAETWVTLLNEITGGYPPQ